MLHEFRESRLWEQQQIELFKCSRNAMDCMELPMMDDQ